MRRSPSYHIPGYSQNAVLQLIVASGSAFIMFHLVRVTLIVFGFSAPEALSTVLPYIGLPVVKEFPTHFWTLLTYGWVHFSFWEWVSNMVWLYCFGNTLQALVDHKHVVPVYCYGLIGGGVFFLLCQLLPGSAFAAGGTMLTGQAGVMALMAGVLTIAPNYRLYFGENFSIPVLVIAAIYLVLTLATHWSIPMLALSAGGALAGFLSMTALKRGIQPAGWFYRLSDRARRLTTPDEGGYDLRDGSRRNSILSNLRNNDLNPKRIDEILDKINQRGYKSLTAEERELLVQASKNGK